MKSISFYTVILLFFALSYRKSNAQVEIKNDTNNLIISAELANDTSETIKNHSAKKAAIFSAVIPGSGQIYNRKYWKAPVVWGGFVGVFYVSQSHHANYIMFREAYVHKASNDPDPPPYPELYEDYKVETLKSYKDQYRRNRDLMYIIGGLWYLLNIVDATVDGHLYSWEVDEDLSIQVMPGIQQGGMLKKNYASLTLTINF